MLCHPWLWLKLSIHKAIAWRFHEPSNHVTFTYHTKMQCIQHLDIQYTVNKSLVWELFIEYWETVYIRVWIPQVFSLIFLYELTACYTNSDSSLQICTVHYQCTELIQNPFIYHNVVYKGLLQNHVLYSYLLVIYFVQL